MIWIPFIKKALSKASRVAAIGMYRIRHPSSLNKQTSMTTSSKVASGKGVRAAADGSVLELPPRRDSVQVSQIIVGDGTDIGGIHFDGSESFV